MKDTDLIEREQIGRDQRTSATFSLNEPLIFERSSAGKKAYSLPPLDVPEAPLDLDPSVLRGEIAGFPEVSEVEVIRHFTRLSSWNYCIDTGMYPLGSCSMKYNPRLNELVARIPGLALSHPQQPEEVSQGNLEVFFRMQQFLAELTGMAEVSLQPAAGAHGELTGILMVRAYHVSQGNPRKYILIPDSAHGTNPASAAIAGYQVKTIHSTSNGRIDVDELASMVDQDVAALMLTNPNTLGIFEKRIQEIARILHDRGAMLYMDGANFNALMGITRPGDMGVDVLHLNLHKTLSTPHGGGGPGSGPVAANRTLAPFLPVPVIAARDGKYFSDSDRPQSIGRMRAFCGQFGMLTRALCYMLTCGGDGLRRLSETAVLNANYIRQALQGDYDLPYSEPCLHEVIFSDRLQNRYEVRTLDIAKRLMDYGFHPPTIYFPLVVPGAIMIEPTESESRAELDAFIAAMKAIARESRENPEIVRNAPHTTRVGRLDETAAARNPVLRWTAPK